MRNEQLQRQDAPPMQDEEFVAARLYTGPMYLKYNATLRYLGWWHMVRDKKRAGEDTQEFEDEKMKENFNRYCVRVAPDSRCLGEWRLRSPIPNSDQRRQWRLPLRTTICT